MSNNWSSDNASNKITCSLWDTSCILESLFRTLSFPWTKSKSRVRTFFWLSVGGKLSLFFGRKAKSRCFWTLLAFSREIIFRFSKRCSEDREQYFETFRFAPRKNDKSVKEFVCFSTTDVFVPVSQLSTRDLFYFLENLKIKQDIFVLSFSSCSIIRTTSVMIPLFQIFGTKCSRKC